MAEPYKQPKYGGFQPPVFLPPGGAVNPASTSKAAGDDESKAALPGMKLGAKFTESTMLRTFEKGFKPLYAGEPYRASNEDKKTAREEAAKQQASEKPFKPPSGPHKTRGKGDYTGTVGRKYEHIGAGDTARKLMKGDVQVPPPNIRTNPSKKGSYGQPGTTLSERKGAKGVAGEYEYKSAPYDSLRYARLEELKAHPIEKPFRPANYPRKGGGTVTPGVLFGRANQWEPGAAAPAEAAGDAEAREPVSSKPFVPSAYPKTGYNRTLDKFPPYVADPLELKVAEERERRQRAKEMAPPKAFVPPNIPKTQATKSILRMNLK